MRILNILSLILVSLFTCVNSDQLKLLFAKAKSGHIDKRKSKNITREFNKLNSTIAELEKHLANKEAEILKV